MIEKKIKYSIKKKKYNNLDFYDNNCKISFIIAICRLSIKNRKNLIIFFFLSS